MRIKSKGHCIPLIQKYFIRNKDNIYYSRVTHIGCQKLKKIFAYSVKSNLTRCIHRNGGNYSERRGHRIV